MNCELPDVQAVFRKGRGTTDQIAIICSIFEKARDFQKYTYFCFIDHTKAFAKPHIRDSVLMGPARQGNWLESFSQVPEAKNTLVEGQGNQAEGRN